MSSVAPSPTRLDVMELNWCSSLKASITSYKSSLRRTPTRRINVCNQNDPAGMSVGHEGALPLRRVGFPVVWPEASALVCYPILYLLSLRPRGGRGALFTCSFFFSLHCEPCKMVSRTSTRPCAPTVGFVGTVPSSIHCFSHALSFDTLSAHAAAHLLF
jgi:hypothetical protein